MTIGNISYQFPRKNVADPAGVNLQPPDHQSDAHPTVLSRPACLEGVVSDNSKEIFLISVLKKYMIWVLTKCPIEVLQTRTKNLCFLCRTTENYPRIIIKYSYIAPDKRGVSHISP